MTLIGRQKAKREQISVIMVSAGLIFCLLIHLAGCSSDRAPAPAAPKQEKVFDLEATKVANKAPLLFPVSDQVAYVGVPLTITLNALDSMGDILSYDISRVNLPDSEDKIAGELPNVSKTDNLAARSFTWTWIPSQAGDFYFKAAVADNGNPIMRDSEIFRIRVCEAAVANEPLELKFYFDDKNPNKPANFSPNITTNTMTSKVPVTGLINNNFQFVDDGFLMTEGEAERGLRIFPATTDVILLLDLSGSTNGVFTEMKAGAKKFVDYVLNTRQNIAIYSFTGEAEIKQIIDFVGVDQNKRNIQSVRSQLYAAINSLDNEIQEGDSSNLYGAIAKGIETLNKRNLNSPTKIDSLVVFSDGRDSAGRLTYANAFDAVKEKPLAYFHNVFTIGFNISPTDTTRKGNVIVDEQNALGKDGFFRAESNQDIVKKFVEAAFAVRYTTLRSNILAFCLSHRAGLKELKATVTDKIGELARSSGEITVKYSADKFTEGCIESVDVEKVKYFDFDGDGHYSVAGGLHDCNDSDPYNWNKCSTCLDKDGDGFGGSGCDINADCQDDPEKEPNADLINPDMTDTTIDGFDQNCDGYDGKRG